MTTQSTRAAYLDRACTATSSFAAKSMLCSWRIANAGSFMERPAIEAEIARALPSVRPLVQPIPPSHHRRAREPGSVPTSCSSRSARGAWASFTWPSKRSPSGARVALKIIKPGMDTEQVIARFEAERQALALMDHPNIARVLDAGTTDTGRPYFVMELVHGVPITKYCDDAQLNPRERLELFVPVCQAIQHAHQKGIIHRDIKPSNVLVTLYDGKPVPKVIDFGVAKAIDQRLTERTMFTQYGSIVGTLEYMSPEQAEIERLGVDTRSDIYSLGVLLYELLTGTHAAGAREAARGGLRRDPPADQGGGAAQAEHAAERIRRTRCRRSRLSARPNRPSWRSWCAASSTGS